MHVLPYVLLTFTVMPGSALVTQTQSVTFRQVQVTSLGTTAASTLRTTVHPTGMNVNFIENSPVGELT